MIDIERLAREAGFVTEGMCFPRGQLADLQRFAALVRNEVLEEAAEACDGVYHQNIGPAHGEVRYGIAVCSSAIRALKDKT